MTASSHNAFRAVAMSGDKSMDVDASNGFPTLTCQARVFIRRLIRSRSRSSGPSENLSTLPAPMIDRESLLA